MIPCEKCRAPLRNSLCLHCLKIKASAEVEFSLLNEDGTPNVLGYAIDGFKEEINHMCLYGEEHYYGTITCEHPDFMEGTCSQDKCPLLKIDKFIASKDPLTKKDFQDIDFVLGYILIDKVVNEELKQSISKIRGKIEHILRSLNYNLSLVNLKIKKEEKKNE